MLEEGKSLAHSCDVNNISLVPPFPRECTVRSKPNVPRRFRHWIALGPLLGLTAAACAHPVLIRSSATLESSRRVANAVAVTNEDQSDVEPPTVVVRDFWRSSAASVVGWSADESWQGLRSSIRNDGTLIRDHALYVSAYAVSDWRLFASAEWHAVVQDSVNPSVLLRNGVQFDASNCIGRRGCSPPLYLSARLPDSLLRSSRDDITVTLHARNGEASVITLHHDLITSYLAVVDSLTFARRKAQ